MDDRAAPTLKLLTLPAVVDVSSGSKKVTVSAQAQDNEGGSGVDRVVVFFDKNVTFSFGAGSNFSIGGLINGSDTFADSTPTSASSEFTLTNATGPGIYNVQQVWVYDVAGNRATYTAQQLQTMGLATSMSVVGGIADSTAPTLVKLELPTTVDLSAGSKQVTVSAQAQDNAGGTGVDHVTVFFDKKVAFSYGAGGNFQIGGLFGNGSDSFKDATPTTANTNFTLTGATTSGTYNVSQVWVEDLAGNKAVYTSQQLKALGIATSFSVVNGMAPTATISQTTSDSGIAIALASTDWSASGSTSFALTVNYDASQVHYGSVTMPGASSSAFSTSVTEYGSYGQVTITGSGFTNGQAQAAIKLAMTPVGASGQFNYTVDTFTVNGKAQTYSQSAAGSVYRGSGSADLVANADAMSLVDGGNGIDTAKFAGTSAAHVIQKSGDGFTVASADGSSTTLVHVERISFSDKSIALDTDGLGGQAYRLYQAAFNRQPDDAGVGFWMTQMERGVSLAETAMHFILSKEFGEMYGVGVSNEVFVAALYQNVLHRAPDQAGYDFWNNALHIADRPTVLVHFSESAENVAQVIGTIEHGFTYTPWV